MFVGLSFVSALVPTSSLPFFQLQANVHMLGDREKRVIFLVRILSAVSLASKDNNLLRFRISAAKVLSFSSMILSYVCSQN
jgi:hypothetical protein